MEDRTPVFLFRTLNTPLNGGDSMFNKKYNRIQELEKRVIELELKNEKLRNDIRKRNEKLDNSREVIVYLWKRLNNYPTWESANAMLESALKAVESGVSVNAIMWTLDDVDRFLGAKES